MDAKALKAALKLAREGVKTKNYAQVHRVAQEILGADPKNYHGLVFLGISLPEVDSSAIKKAVEAFKEAAEVGPDQPLAWQGLATLYEKNPIKIYQEALPEVYKKLMGIYEKAGGDIMDKYFDVGIKLAKLYLDERRKDLASCAETYQTLLDKAEAQSASGASQSAAWTKKVAKAAADSLGNRVNELPKEQGTLVEKIFVVLVTIDDEEEEKDSESQASDEQKCEYFERWIRAMLSNSRPVADIIGACGLMRETFPEALFPLQLLVNFELSLGCCAGDEVGGGGSVSSNVDLGKLEQLGSVLRRFDRKAPLISGIEGVDAFATKNFAGARDSFKTAFDSFRRTTSSAKSLNVSIGVFLARSYYAIHDHSAAESTIKEVKDYLSSSEKESSTAYASNAFISSDRVSQALDLLSARAKIEGGGSEEEMESAISALERLVSQSDGSGESATTSSAASDPLGAFIGVSSSSSLSVDRIEDMVNLAKSRGFESNASLLTLEGVLLAKKGDLASATQQFVRTIELYPENGQLRFWLGKTLWDKTMDGLVGSMTEDQLEEHREELDVCFSELLLAAKFDRFYAPTFLCLGHYYLRVQDEPTKALKCYQRSFDLDNTNGEAGSRCVDLLTSQDRAEEALALLIDVTKSAAPSRGSKWAWLRLAVRHLDVGDYDAAVTTLQDLLKADASDWNVWECLGEAYCSRGSHTAALKAFERAVELNSKDAAFSRFQTAHIKQVTGAFLEAAADYAALLEEQPDFIPVLVRMGETSVQLAREALGKYFNRKTVDLIEKAVSTLTHAASLRPDLVCVWKLLGDACTIVREAPDHHCANVKVPAKLAHDPEAAERKMKIRKMFTFETSWETGAVESQPAWDEENQTESTEAPEAKGQRVRVKRNRRGKDAEEAPADPTGDKEVNKLELLLIGNRCYRRALKLQQEVDHSLLHDLAFNYFAQVDAIDEEDKDSRLELSANALECLKEAVSLEPGNHQYWLALGTVASCAPPPIQKPSLAQHAFIKSIQCESNNVVAWTNLGALYLAHGPTDRKLAHLAFKTAQNLDPGYVGAWVGQAMIAEAIGDPEAMDLFRVTVSMENNAVHSQGLIGYGHWVCKMLLRRAKESGKSSIGENDDDEADAAGYPPSSHLRYIFEKMGAIDVAADALAKFCDRFPENVEGASMLAMLQERQGLHQSAVNHLRRALDSLKGLGLAVQSEVETIRSNYARVLRSLDKGGESVSQYKQLVGLEKNLLHLCGLGLALFKMGNLTESYVVFEKCVELTTDSTPLGVRACLQTCIAMVSHKYSDLEGAKAALFKCVEMDPTFMPGLVALASIGILNNDSDLTIAALQELLEAPSLPEEQTFEAARLYASLMLEDGAYKAGKTQIQKAILRHPQSSKLWTFLAQYILRYAKDGGAMATVAARSAQAVDPKNEEGVLLESLGMLVSSSPLDNAPFKRKSRCSKSAITAAAKAVHLHPDRLEAWSSLAASTYAMDVMKRVSPNNAPETAKDGAALAASRAAFAVSSVKTSTFASLGTTSHRLHAFIVKHHVFNLLVNGGGDSLREAKRVINELQENGNRLEATGPLLFHLEILVSKGVSNRTLESFKEAVQWENSLFAQQLMMEIYRQSRRLAEIQSMLEASAFVGDHPGRVVFQALLMVDALTDLSRVEDPLTAKSEEARKILKMIADSDLKEKDVGLLHLVNGITLFKSNIKQAQKALLKVHNARFPVPISDVPGKIARRLLVQVLGGKKEKEKSTLEALRASALKEGDVEFIKIYEQTVPAL